MSLINSLNHRQIEFGKVPVVFISYDEPNADENYQHLRDNHPNPSMISRVHGVKGFDSAHKCAARQADFDRFFSIDGDCQVDPALWQKRLTLDRDHQSATLSWSSRNLVNGLVYGNGSVKLWHSEYVLAMRSHEAADPNDSQNNIDFCWDADNYKLMNNTYGLIFNNASPKQAFRSGFREGIKMGLNQGVKILPKNFAKEMYPANYARWLIWMTVGRDVANGNWVMYGARLAASLLYIEGFDYSLIADYDWFDELWEQQLDALDDGEYLEHHSRNLANQLKEQLDLPVEELTSEQSIWFKHCNFSPLKGTPWSVLLNQSSLPLFGFETPNF
jgi:hypothetical protein